MTSIDSLCTFLSANASAAVRKRKQQLMQAKPRRSKPLSCMGLMSVYGLQDLIFREDLVKSSLRADQQLGGVA